MSVKDDDPYCPHCHDLMVYKLRDAVDWAEMTRACYSCQKCLGKMTEWVGGNGGTVLIDRIER